MHVPSDGLGIRNAPILDLRSGSTNVGTFSLDPRIFVVDV